jgi:hypothetical protein
LAELASRVGIPSVIGELSAGLIFAQLGLSIGILSADLYAALLVVIALTTALPPFALKWFYGRYGDKPGLKSTAGSD